MLSSGNVLAQGEGQRARAVIFNDCAPDHPVCRENLFNITFSKVAFFNYFLQLLNLQSNVITSVCTRDRATFLP